MKALSFRLSISIAGTLFLLDRLAKYLVGITSEVPFDITSWFSIDYVLNRGISWGLFSFASTIGFVVVSITIACLLGTIVWWTHRSYKRQESITAQLLIIFGGVSNLIDRALYGGVIDYIGINIMGWQFPWFNIADAAINVGVFLLVLQSVQHE